jgi:hypothetical protein
MHETLRETGLGRRVLGAALVFGWIVGVGLLFLLWEAVGAFLGMGLLVHYGLAAVASADVFYRLSACAAGLALLVHAWAGVWPFHHGRREP